MPYGLGRYLCQDKDVGPTPDRAVQNTKEETKQVKGGIVWRLGGIIQSSILLIIYPGNKNMPV